MVAYILDNMTLDTRDVFEFGTYEFIDDINYKSNSTIEGIKKPTVKDDDIVFCKEENKTVFVGLCYNYNSGSADEYTLTLRQKENLFDRNVFKDSGDMISSVGLEDFIAKTITDNWVAKNGDDPKDAKDYKRYLNLICKNPKTGLESHTKIETSIETLSDTEVDTQVYSFITLLSNAKLNYQLNIDFDFDFEAKPDKMIDVYIYVDKSEQVPIDISSSEIESFDDTFDIDVLSKLNIKWKRADGRQNEDYSSMVYIKGNGQTSSIPHGIAVTKVVSAEFAPTGDCWVIGNATTLGIRALSDNIVVYAKINDSGTVKSFSVPYVSGDEVKAQISASGASIWINGIQKLNEEYEYSFSGSVPALTGYTIGVNGKLYSVSVSDGEKSDTFTPTKKESSNNYGVKYSSGTYYAMNGSGWIGTLTDDLHSITYYLLADDTITIDPEDTNRIDGTVDSKYYNSTTPEELHQTVLNEFQRNKYEHRISFNLLKDSSAYPVDEYFVGRKIKIRTAKSFHENSLITETSFTDDKPYVTITCGKLPVSLTEKLKGVIKW